MPVSMFKGNTFKMTVLVCTIPVSPLNISAPFFEQLVTMYWYWCNNNMFLTSKDRHILLMIVLQNLGHFCCNIGVVKLHSKGALWRSIVFISLTINFIDYKMVKKIVATPLPNFQQFLLNFYSNCYNYITVSIMLYIIKYLKGT